MKKTLRSAFVVITIFLVWGCASTSQNVSLLDVNSEDALSSGFPYSGNSNPLLSGTESSQLQNDYFSKRSTSSGNATSLTAGQNAGQLSATPGVQKKAGLKRQASSATPQKKKARASLDEALEYCQVSQEFWQKGEIENALEALDHAYSLILEVDDEDNLKLFREKEDLRFAISKRILEIYASRHVVVSGQHNEIPMVINKHVQAEIDLLTGAERQFFIDSYRRSGRFRQHILNELKKAGLPEALSWLPLIESGFKVNALSKARALGLWQFIASTGYKFGLNRDHYIDERLNPIKSTTAAISYLKELHQLFGDWTTALAAYNCGEGRVLREISTQNINYLDNFWDLYEKLPRETARYVPRFLAVLHILKNPSIYGYESLPVDSPMEYETVQVNREVHLDSIASVIGIPEETLKILNSELRYGILPNDTYTLLIPPGTKERFLAEIDNIPHTSLPKTALDETSRVGTYASHRVRKGETLSNIAASYGTSVDRIMDANSNLSKRGIIAGTKLKIPLKGTIPAVCERPSLAKAKEQSNGFHTVKQGDSIWTLARQYCTTAQKLKALNNLESYSLQHGQLIRVAEPSSLQKQKEGTPPPDKIERASSRLQTDNKKQTAQTKQAAEASKKKEGTKYVVQKGDTVYTIAKKSNMPLDDFLMMNRITSQSKIFPGQILYVQ